MVTAVYNGEAYLEDTIRSLVYQGYPNLEYIIVNDGSTDRTAEIIRDYERYLTAWINQDKSGTLRGVKHRVCAVHRGGDGLAELQRQAPHRRPCGGGQCLCHLSGNRVDHRQTDGLQYSWNDHAY